MIATLVVADYDERGWDGLAPILAELERRNAAPVLADREPFTTPKGRTVSQCVITFDDNAVRNTHVHGWVCDVGYPCHIEY